MLSTPARSVGTDAPIRPCAGGANVWPLRQAPCPSLVAQHAFHPCEIGGDGRPHPALCRWSDCLATTAGAMPLLSGQTCFPPMRDRRGRTPPSGLVPVERLFGHYGRRHAPP